MCIFMPFVAWVLVRIAQPQASLASAYVFDSPFLLIAICGTYATVTWRKKYGRLTQDVEGQLNAGAFADKLGAKDVEFLLFEEHLADRKIRTVGSRILVEAGYWKTANIDFRELILATAVTQIKCRSDRWLRWELGVAIAVFLGSALASLSLWVVLPIHVVLLVTAIRSVNGSAKREAFTVDQITLRLTRNYPALQDWISRYNEYAPYHVKRSERLDRLEAEARKLGLDVASDAARQASDH